MTTQDYQKKGILAIFLSFFKRHKKLFFLDIGCAILAAVVDLAYPMVSRTAMTELLPERAFTAFFAVMAILLVAYVLRAGLFYIVNYWGHTFGVRVEADIRHALFTHMQTLGFDFFTKNRTGQLMSRITSDLFDLTELSHHGPEDVVIALITIVGALIMLFTIQWQLALVIALIIPVFILTVCLRRRSMSEASKALKVKIGEITADIESGLSGIKTAKAFANEDLENQKFRRANDRFKSSKSDFYREMGLFNATMELFLGILSVTVIAVGGWLIMKKQMGYVDLITFSLYVSTFVTPIRKLAFFSELFAGGYAGLKRFVDIMRTEPTLQDSTNAQELQDVAGEIEIQNVSFHYTQDLDVLQNVSFTVKAGETIAVVGPSGGGKTTLCQLIPRFYDVSEGAITIDGKDVRLLTQKSLRKNIGIVQQDVFLFADTVLENIRYGKPDATMEEVISAAKRAEIYDDIIEMPNQFDTFVGERGTLLSGGQKQRIAIARIFLKNPPILILDEATSALDSVTEAKIQRAFDELAKGRTTLIIAHRLSTIKNADRIMVISDGDLTEAGDHDTLMQKNGVYAALYNTQTKLR